MRPLSWAGPVLALLGLAAVAAIALHPAAERGLPERGALSLLLSYDRVLPLLGLGAALALAGPRRALPGLLLFALGLWLGFAGQARLIAAVVSGPGMASRLALTGPLACLVAGAVLVLPPRPRSWALLPGALLLGALLALTIKLNDPSLHDPGFVRGATAAALWAVAAPALAAGRLERPWCRIAVRIFGSWLLAIGLLVGGAGLLPPRGAEGPPASPGLDDPWAPGAEAPPDGQDLGPTWKP